MRMNAQVVCCLAVLLFLASSLRTRAQSPARITQPIDESQVATLRGNTRPEANSKNDRGAVADSFDVEHILLLLQRSPEQEQELDKLIDELNDRTSPSFHNWLTAAEFGQRFGVAPQDIDNITNWLESHGFRVNRVYPNQILIDFSGTAGQIRDAFHTEIHQLEVNGEPHVSNMSDPRIPVALAPVVKGIFSLNDFKPHPMMINRTANPLYTFAGCAFSTDFPTEPGTCYAVTPQDEQVIYNLTPLYPAPGNSDGGGKVAGQGVNVAVVEDSDTYNYPGDWNTFRSTFGLASAYPFGTYTESHPGGCTDPGTNGDDGEAAIDVEEVTAFAPNANVYLISCPSTTFTFGGQIALQNLINEPSSGPYSVPGGIGIISVSYGACEAATGAGGNATFYDTYQQAVSEGVSVFVASGDELATSCGDEFSNYPHYSVASVSVSGWASTPYNVAVGATDFEDTYNSQDASPTVPLSTYWNSTNTASYGSAKSYIPEIPWNNSCASVLIGEYARGSFNTYGVSGTGVCNTSPYSTTSSYEDDSMIGSSGGPSNCATGSAGLDQTDYLITAPYCQGYAKPSWQSVLGNPADGVRDLPDVSLFGSNGPWGHYAIFCWSDPSYTSDGAASCGGAPSTWSGFGGTSLAAPSFAAIQALINEKTREAWGNVNTMYYAIANTEYGASGNSSCNSNKSPDTSNDGVCSFYDITQGDIDAACRYNGTVLEDHCYKPSTNGVLSTDNVTGATVINGGTGYSAPTCTIAAPSNLSPYLAPTGATLWAGGTQATCTATVSSTSTTAKYTLTIESATAGGEPMTVGPQTYTLTGASTTAIATNLASSIDGSSTVATATSSGATVTITAKTAGYAGNFNVTWGTGFLSGEAYVENVDTTLGQGPNYVSGITITAAGSGYGPDTPITLTDGAGTGAIAVANTTPGTAAQSYQPAFGATPGWDFATGIGSVNAANLVNNWPSPPPAPTLISATVVSPTEIDLAWTNPTGSNATGNSVLRCTGSSCTPTTAIASLSATSTSYQDKSVSSLTSYTYLIQATNTWGSTNSNSLNATTPASNLPPSIVSVTPSSGSGLGPQTFSFVYSDPNGFTYLNTVQALFSATGSSSNSCWFRYLPAINGLYLMNDAGTTWLGPMTPGSAGTLLNTQCTVNVGSSSASGSGNNLSLNLAITFSSSFAGNQSTWMKADDNGGQTSSWQIPGSWSIPPAVNQPPSVVSVTPNSGSGLGPQTFNFVYSDPNGFSYLNTVQALFSVTGSGASACWALYVQPTNNLYLMNDAGTSWTGPMNPGTAGTLQNSQCSVNLDNSSASRSGNNLTLNLAITFNSSFAGNQSIRMKADDNGGQTSGWQIPGSWSIPPAVNQPPSVVSVTPNSGNGLGPKAFSFSYSDPNGFNYLNTVQALFSATGSGANSCWLRYVPSLNNLYMMNDAGSSWIGPMNLGTAGTLQNSQCGINVGSSSVSESGNNLTLNLAITFTSSFAGTQSTWMKADDNGGQTSGWQVPGSWSIPPAVNQPPSVVSVTPSSGSGLGPQTFSFVYSDPNGFNYLNTVQALFSVTGSGANACWALYVQPTNNLYLMNDAGTSWTGPMNPGTAGTLQNSQCSVNLGSSSALGSGNNLTLNLAITFNSSFAGSQSTWMKADDNGGQTSGWQIPGSWSVP